MKGRKLKFLCAFLIGLFISMQVNAQEDLTERTVVSDIDNEVVFLLDTSNSMNARDKGMLIPDGIRQMVYGMPSNTRIGFAAYNTDIQCITPLSTDTGQMEKELGAIRYAGYSNAGMGLEQAVALFSDDQGVNRHIVMISDGEIITDNDADTQEAVKIYAEAVKKASEKGIRIDIAALGEEEGTEIFTAAESTGGSIYAVPQSGDFTQTANRILTECIQFPRRSVGTMQGENGSLHVELPAKGADHARILLAGDGNIKNVNANYSAEGGRIIAGNKFAVIDISRPAGKTVDITFEAEENITVDAWLVTEYRAWLAAEIDYRREIRETEDTQKANADIEYDHYADIVIRLMNRGGEEDNIWDDDYYKGKNISFTVNDDKMSGKVEEGMLAYSMRADSLEQIDITLDTADFSEIFYIEQPLEIEVQIPPDPVPEEKTDYRPLWVIVALLAVMFFVSVLLWIRKNRATVIYVEKAASSRTAQKCETKSCEYTGKFNLYVVQTANGQDIAPQTFRLFGRKNGRISLEWILNTCKVRLAKMGAEDIIFYPGPDKSVIVMDQSEHCTVMRGTEILKKGIGYPVYYNEKLTVTFEDGVTEMEIHYKNLKPGEREDEGR